MPSYTCKLCNFETTFRRNYTRHLKTKKHLTNENIWNNYEESIENDSINFLSEPKKAFLRLTNDSQTTQNDSKEQKCGAYSTFEKSDSPLDKMLLKCEFCNKEFSRGNNLNRHKKYYCKEIKHKNYREEEMKLQIKEKSEQMERLIEKLSNINHTINHSNISNCNNNSNNIVNDITINNFGSENLEMLSNKFMNSMIDRPYTAIPKMIKKIHFNDKYPENKNIRMLNKKDNKLQIISNGKWTYVDKLDTIDILVGDKNYKLEDYYENNENYFSDIQKQRFQNFQEKISYENKKVSFEIVKGTDLVFWNNM